MSDYIFYFLGAFFISLIAQKIVISLSHKHVMFIDDHESDKPQNFHENPTPRAGGIGLFLASLLIIPAEPLQAVLILPIMLAFASGIIEDFNGRLTPIQRIVMQLIASITVIVLANSIVTYLGLGIYLPIIVGAAFTAFAIVGSINAINIIDGFNGLAGIITLSILTSFSIVAYLVGDSYILLFNLIIMGAIIGFLVFNFPSGKIFLGDGGAYMLGFVTAFSGIYLASNYDVVSPWFVLSVMIYPVFEVMFSIYRKRKRGMSPMQPDGVHFHMLINKRIARNNPKTTLYIFLLVMPFIFAPVFFYVSSIANIISVIVFISTYVLIYRHIVTFQQNKFKKKIRPSKKIINSTN